MTFDHQTLRTYFTGPRRQALVAALVVLALLLPMGWQASRWYQAWRLADQRAKLVMDLAQPGNALTSALNQRFALLKKLGAFVQARQGDLSDPAWAAEFEAFAAGLYASTDGIRRFAVAPAGIQEYIYPPAGDEAGLGQDLLDEDQPAVRAAAQRAIETGQITLSGRGEFDETNRTLIALLAIYQEDTLWGFVTAVLDVPAILNEANLETHPAHLELALRNQADQVFYGQRPVFEADPLLYRIKLPEGYWELAGVPVEGWQTSTQRELFLFQGAGLIIIGLFASLVYLVINRQARLSLAVQQRTWEISKINEELGRDIVRRQQAEAVLRETQRTLATLMSNLPGMAYRSRNDTGRTMQFISEGCLALTGYQPAELIENARFSYMQLIHPADRKLVWERVQAALAKDQPFQITYRLTTAGGEEKWVWEQGRAVLSPEGNVLALEGFITDTTERMQAYQMLEQQVIDRTRALTALYEVTAMASKSLDLTTTLERSLDQVLNVMRCEIGAIHLLDSTLGGLRLAVWRGLPPEALAEIDVWLSGKKLASRVIKRGESLVVSHLAADPQAPPFIRARSAQAYVGVPMRARGRVLGVLSVISEAGQQFKVEAVALLASIADEIGVAAENAQLHEAERVQRRQADTLLQVVSVVGSTLELEEVLARILDQLRRVVDYDSASVQLLEEGRLQVIAARGFSDNQQVLGLTFSTSEAPNHKVVVESRPLNLADAPTLYPVFCRPPFSHIRSWLGVPLHVQERIIGIITVERQQPGGYAEEEVRLATAFADQVALALENARLYQQAEQLAVMEERSRLARELHDSVTQSLYSLTLFAEVGRRSAEAGHLEQVLDYMSRLSEVAQQALKEMRLLVYELRTSALETEGLVGALHQRLDAVEKRAGVEAHLLVEAMAELPALVEEGLYRIAQEALNNILKHAAATTVTVRINANSEWVELEIIDNGRAFDPGSLNHSGGMGLTSMRERAERLGGTLLIRSKRGEGTRVRVTVPTRRRWSRPVLPIDKFSEVSQ